MANTLADAVRCGVGVALLLLLAIAWASLATWSPLDPSLSQATSTPPRNWLGLPGAIVSDILIQAFGLAVLVFLLPPMTWAMALVRREPMSRVMARTLSWIAAVGGATIAAASVPTFAAWPLRHGLGGILGDVGLRLLSGPLSLVGGDDGRVLTGVVMACGAIACLMHALATRTVTLASFKRGDRAHQPSPRDHTSHHPGHDHGRVVPALTMNATASARHEPNQLQPRMQSEPPVASQPPRSESQFGPYAAFEIEDDPVDDEFDEWTAAASSGMAARFAPATATAQALQTSLISAFMPQPEPRAVDRPGNERQSGFAVQAQQPQPAGGFGLRALSRTQGYTRPSLNLLERPRTARGKPTFAATMQRGNARLLEDGLAEFGVIGTVGGIKPGPVVTLYEFEPARGTNAARVVSLANDVARFMGVATVRISQMLGRSMLAVELPNQLRETVYLRDIFDAEAYRSTMDQLPVVLGRTVTGEAIVSDLSRMPNLLIAGAPGSGKSVGINAMILSLIYKHGPDNCRFLLIDPKMLKLSVYDGIPHLLTPVVSDPHKAITALSWCVREMEERYKRMASLGVRDIDVFNNRVRNAKKRGERLARTVQTGYDDTTGKAKFVQEEMNLEPLPFIVIVIEEFADLMAVAGKEIEGSVKRLSDAARGVGIHLIMATERPSADIATPQIKDSLPTRITYKVATKVDSRVMLGIEGAEHLLGQGDMLYTTGAGQPVRMHGPFVSSEEVATIAQSLRQQGEPRYIVALTEALGRGAKPSGHRGDPPPGQPSAEDALYDRAVAIVLRDGVASVAHLQRRLNVSAAWAQSLLARLEQEAIVGPVRSDGSRAVIVGAAA